MEEKEGPSFPNSPKKNAKVVFGTARGSWKRIERKSEKGIWLQTNFSCLEILLMLCASVTEQTVLSSLPSFLPCASHATAPRTWNSGGGGIRGYH